MADELRDLLLATLKDAGNAIHAEFCSSTHDALCARIESVIVKAEAAPSSGEWRPIATAPKDGSIVLGRDSDGYAVVAFCAPMDGWLIEGTETVAHPTRWMPLPPLQPK